MNSIKYIFGLCKKLLIIGENYADIIIDIILTVVLLVSVGFSFNVVGRLYLDPRTTIIESVLLNLSLVDIIVFILAIYTSFKAVFRVKYNEKGFNLCYKNGGVKATVPLGLLIITIYGLSLSHSVVVLCWSAFYLVFLISHISNIFYHYIMPQIGFIYSYRKSFISAIIIAIAVTIILHALALKTLYFTLLITAFAALIFKMPIQHILQRINLINEEEIRHSLNRALTQLVSIGTLVDLTMVISFWLFVIAISGIGPISIGDVNEEMLTEGYVQLLGTSDNYHITPDNLIIAQERLEDLAGTFFSSIVNMQVLVLSLLVGFGFIKVGWRTHERRNEQRTLPINTANRIQEVWTISLEGFFLLYLLIIYILISGMILFKLIDISLLHNDLKMAFYLPKIGSILAILCFEFSFISVLPSLIYAYGLTTVVSYLKETRII